MRIVVGADHAGFILKQEIARDLRAQGHDVIDVGTDSTDPVDYPDFALAVANAVIDEQAERGVLICGSGVGASVAANKVRGIRAGICHDTYSAHQGVEHDNMLAHELVRAFIGATFNGEPRHVRRLAKITALEDEW